jgi:hypothetical protein
MSLSRGAASLSRTASNAKKWLKQKAKSKPFQWIISVGQGLSLGSSFHDALSKILSLTSLAGLAARIAANVNYGVAGLVTFIMSYMTYSYVHTNITSESSTAERLQDHADQLETHEKRFLNQQQSSVELIQILLDNDHAVSDALYLDQQRTSTELIQILLKGNIESEDTKARLTMLLEKSLANYATFTQQKTQNKTNGTESQRELKKLLDKTINNYVAFNHEHHEAQEEKNHHATPSLMPVDGTVDEHYYPMQELSSVALSPSARSLASRTSYSDRMFGALPHEERSSSAPPTNTNHVAINIAAEDDHAHISSQTSSRLSPHRGGSIV